MKKLSLKVKELIKTNFTKQGPTDISARIFSNRVNMLKKIKHILSNNLFINKEQILFNKLNDLIRINLSIKSDESIEIFKDLNNPEFINIEMNDKEIINSIEKIYVEYLNDILEYPTQEDNKMHYFSAFDFTQTESMIQLALDKYESFINSTIEIDLKTIILSFSIDPLNYNYKPKHITLYSLKEYQKNFDKLYEYSGLSYALNKINDNYFYNELISCTGYMISDRSLYFSRDLRNHIMTQINMYANILSIERNDVTVISLAVEKFCSIIQMPIESYFYELIKKQLGTIDTDKNKSDISAVITLNKNNKEND